MNYNKVYNKLINKRKLDVITEGYCEKHHIVMKSMGGSNDKSNIVKLTAREHYIAHLLLHRIHQCSKTAYALWRMQCRDEESNKGYIINSRMYEWARKEFCKYMSREMKIKARGKRNSQYGTMWICNIELKKNKKISKNEEIPDGWEKGRNKWNLLDDSKSVRTKLESHIPITNGVDNKYLYYEDQLPIPQGWTRGTTFSDEAKNKLSKNMSRYNIKNNRIRTGILHPNYGKKFDGERFV